MHSQMELNGKSVFEMVQYGSASMSITILFVFLGESQIADGDTEQ